MRQLSHRYEHDKTVWNSCAKVYEEHIVHGHPEVTDYEDFEHTFLDRLITCLCRDHGRNVHMYDFGCGSGRLHLFFGGRMKRGTSSQEGRGSLAHVGGIDFSSEMIELAKQKVRHAGLEKFVPERLSFDTGSAFDVPAYSGEHLPLAVSVCNSVGVMQDVEGARRLFESMRAYVEVKKGIAVISGYKKEAVASHALGNYESTLDVCGQPCWLDPDTYSSSDFIQRPHYYKRAYAADATIPVDVFDRNGNVIEREFILRRNQSETEKVITSGAITTCADYNSRWYAKSRFRHWMRELWPHGTRWHIDAEKIDALRGAPAQLALLDCSGLFETLARRWRLRPLS
ncbi:MAG: methyltransferase domain-containing protein [Chitinispirillaceae bacterium]|nr:methyltransferase domain-containing protein [Chitinispirillaceae bacterium]